MSTEPHDTFNRISGEILRIAVNVEGALEHFLSNYFCGINSFKNNFFEDEILQKLNFQKKIELFEKICKKEGFDKNKLKKILEDIKFIQKTRNKVAHYESSFEGPMNNIEEWKIRLWPRKSEKNRRDSLVLTQNLVNKLSKRFLSVNKGIIADVHNYLIEQKKLNIIQDSQLENIDWID